jgi:predicted nucleotidyltransferase component of viral defense system
VDVGFGDAVSPAPQEMLFPTLLDFPSPALRAYRPETVIAEKFQAMVDLGLRNTRLKDFYDIWKLAQQSEFEGEVLAEAIRATFARRHTTLPTDVPLALSDKFAEDPLKISQWAGFLRKSALRDQGTSLAEVITLLGDFLLPPLRAVREGESFTQHWTKTGKWEAGSD